MAGLVPAIHVFEIAPIWGPHRLAAPARLCGPRRLDFCRARRGRAKKRHCVIPVTASSLELDDSAPRTINVRPTRCEEHMFDRSAASAMSPEMRATLGESRLAYIKAIRSEEVAFLSPE